MSKPAKDKALRARPMRNVLITGARGFVGVPTVAALREAGWQVVAACRGAAAAGGAEDYREVVVGELGPETDWREALRGVDAVLHLAARVHQMRDTAADPMEEFRRVNVAGTRRLAEQAAAAGVRRFVFVSSIKVNGEGTAPGRRFRADDAPAPEDPYGRSKLEAEEALRAVGEATGMEVVVVRPPLMVGKGVKGNLASLAEAIRKGRPLPLGGITANRRSLLDVRNLADVLERCLWHHAVAGRVFLVSDGVPVSTAELARQIGRAAGRAPRLVPIPAAWLRLAGRLTGRAAAVDRLTGSLEIDDRETRERLEWTPRFGPKDWEL